MKNEVLGMPIRFKPIVGNLEHIAIVEMLGEIGKLRVRYDKAMIEDRRAGKIYEDIMKLESDVRRRIGKANGEKI
jgi:hypothetical protein